MDMNAIFFKRYLNWFDKQIYNYLGYVNLVEMACGMRRSACGLLLHKLPLSDCRGNNYWSTELYISCSCFNKL